MKKGPELDIVGLDLTARNMRSCFSTAWALAYAVITLICLRECKWWGGVGVVYSARVSLVPCAMSQPRRRKGDDLFAKRDVNLRAHHLAKQVKEHL